MYFPVGNPNSPGVKGTDRNTQRPSGVVTSSVIFVACWSPSSPPFNSPLFKLRERIPRQVDYLHLLPPLYLQAQWLCSGPWHRPGPSAGVQESLSGAGSLITDPLPGERHVQHGVCPSGLFVQVGDARAVGTEFKAGDLRPRLLGLRTGAHCFRATPWGSKQASKISWEFLEVGSPFSVVFQKPCKQLLPYSMAGSPTGP